ncbi:MAG: hypothetical protein ABIN61_05675 [candidate division WOR-3 bacterium]
MQKISNILLSLLLLSCSRTVYQVTYSNVCGSKENFIYTSKETDLSCQTFNFLGGYYEGSNPPQRRAIVGINIQTNFEEEIYLFREPPQGTWGSLDVSNDLKKIAVVLNDTLCIISRESEEIIAKIVEGRNPCFFPSADSLLYAYLGSGLEF